MNMKRRIRFIMCLMVMLSLAGLCPGSGRVSEAAVKNSGISAKARETAKAQGTAKAQEADSGFEVHFIDVGQADAALVLCDGKAMLIDGGNAADSSLLYTYLKKHGIDHLAYIVCTHAHEDHVGGLSGALNYAKADRAFCPVTSYDSRAFTSFVSYLKKQNVSIEVPKAGDRFSLGSASVQVLGPVTAGAEDPNNTSIVLRVVYGKTSFLFTGDAEREEEQEILESGCPLESTVLKVGHHGSGSSTTYPFLREIMPEYAVISVGADNTYGHPDTDTLSRLRDAGVKVFRTDMQGDIVCVSDGKNVTFSTERGGDADTLGTGTLYSTKNASGDGESRETSSGDGKNRAASSGGGAGAVRQPETEAADGQPEIKASDGKSGTDAASRTQAAVGTDYVLNTNTHKFHYTWCSSVRQMKEKNKEFFTGTREELIARGYDPCGNCNP